MNLNVTLAKSQFFDRAVTKGMDAATKRVLSRFGAFVRRSAKSSLRPAKQRSLGSLSAEERARFESAADMARRNGRPRPRRPEEISRPGEPPKLHSRPSPLRELIFFVYDPKEKAVLIGPAASSHTRGDATEALEHGGASMAVTRGRRRRIRVEPRPFMAPAMNKELPKLREWRNTVK
jgi:hypothetical protein